MSGESRLRAAPVAEHLCIAKEAVHRWREQESRLSDFDKWIRGGRADDHTTCTTGSAMRHDLERVL